MKKKNLVLAALILTFAIMSSLIVATNAASDVASLDDGRNFSTLEEAINAAGDGDVVTLLADSSGNGVIINKDITIDLGGNTYTFNGTLVGSAGTQSIGFQILNGANVTIKNGALVMDEAAKRGHDNAHGNNFVLQNYANLTLTDVAVTGCAHTSYVFSNNSGNVLLEGETSITAANEKVAIDVCEYASYPTPTVTINTTGTIDGRLEVSGGDLTVDDGNFIGSGEDGLLYVVSGSATVNGGNFNASLGSGNYSMAVWVKGGEATINGGTFKNATDGSERGTDLIYVSGDGEIAINGGTFEAATPEWTLNIKDNSRDTAEIVVNGGSFKDFNPADCKSEGNNTNFIAKDKEIVEVNGEFKVKTKPYADAIGTNGDSHGTLSTSADGMTVTLKVNAEEIKWLEGTGSGIRGNWIGFKITAPEGIDAADVTILRPDGQTRNLAAIKDSAAGEPVYAHLYKSIVIDRINTYKIDWNSDGVYDLNVVIDGTDAILEPFPVYEIPETPATGDAGIVVLVAVMAIAGAALVLVSKKRKATF